MAHSPSSTNSKDRAPKPPVSTYGTPGGNAAVTSTSGGLTGNRPRRRNLSQKAGGFFHLSLPGLINQGKRPAHIAGEIPRLAPEPLKLLEAPIKRNRATKNTPKRCSKRTYPHCQNAKSRRAAAANRKKAKKLKKAA